MTIANLYHRSIQTQVKLILNYIKNRGEITIDKDIGDRIFKRRTKHGFAALTSVKKDENGPCFHFICYNTLTGEFRSKFISWHLLDYYGINMQDVLLFVCRYIYSRFNAKKYDVFVDKFNEHNEYLFSYQCESWSFWDDVALYEGKKNPLTIIEVWNGDGPQFCEFGNSCIVEDTSFRFKKFDGILPLNFDRPFKKKVLDF